MTQKQALPDAAVLKILNANLGRRVRINYTYVGGYAFDTWQEHHDVRGVIRSIQENEGIVEILKDNQFDDCEIMYFGLFAYEITAIELLKNDVDRGKREVVDSTPIENNKNIFISHGHNEIVMSRVERFLRDRLHLKPIILQHMPDQGMTIVEKLEKYSPLCCFGIVLMTEDDEQKGSFRARQNVIHEIGYLQGKYGRDRVVMLRQDDTELFSNISGIVYHSFAKDGVEQVFDSIRINLEAMKII